LKNTNPQTNQLLFVSMAHQVPPTVQTATCPGCAAEHQPIALKMKRKQVAGGVGLTTVGALAVPFFWWTGVPFVALGGGVAMIAGQKRKRYLCCQECGSIYNLHTKRAHTMKRKPSQILITTSSIS
jgi:hypothetical protein